MFHSNRRNAFLIGLLSLFITSGAFALTGSADSVTTPLETISPRLESVSAASDASLSATFSEPLRSPGATATGNYVVSGMGAGTLAPHPAGLSGVGPYTLNWGEGEMRNGTSAVLTVSGVQDAVGNPVNPFKSCAWFLGMGSGPVFEALQVTPAQAGRGDSVMIAFTVSEALGADPAVAVNGHAASIAASGKSIPYSYTYTVLADEALGMAGVSISGEDLAGNTGSLTSNGVLEIVDQSSTLPLHVWPMVLALLVAGIAAMAWRRKRLAVVLLAAALLASSSATAEAPSVSNVTVVQNANETSTQVDIYFDLVAPNSPCAILLSLSKDGGTDNFIFPIRHYTGDVSGVITGTDKHIVWDIRADYPEMNLPLAQIRITADDSAVAHTLTYTAGEHGSITGTSPQNVLHGSDGTAVNAVPDTGYHFVQWSDGSTDNPRTDTSVTGDVTVTALFCIDVFTLTYMAGLGGSISGVSPQTVMYDTDGTETVALPDPGYHFVQWSDGVLTATRTETHVMDNLTVSAEFAISTYTLDYLPEANGSISGLSPQTVDYRANGAEVTAVPDPHYHFVQWSDGVLTAARTDTNVVADITVTASFAIDTYGIACNTVGSGTCTADPVTVDHGSTSDITATPADGWHIVSVEDSVEGTKSGSYTTTAVTGVRTVTATFAINTYEVACSVVGNGTCIASPAVVDHGSTSDIAVTPADHWHIVSVVDSVEGAKSGSYTTMSITAARTVTATFAIDTFTLTYTAGDHGSITGASPQTVGYGASGTEVTAVPNSGYMFSQWSDDMLTAARTDGNVTGNITVTANFLPPPVVTSFAINGGAATTMPLAVTLNNVVTNNPAEYMASESATFAGAVWMAYASAPSFTLSFGVGTRTVYFKTRNAAGESNVMNDSIFIVPTLVPVSAGTFTMGRTSAGDDATHGQSYELPAHPVTLSPYQIGKYIATNKEFCDVLNWALAQGYLKTSAGAAWTGTGDIYAGANLQPIFAITDPTCNVQFSGGTFSSKTRTGLPGTTDYSMDRHPLVDMYWFGAVAFCNWLSQWQGLTPCYDMGVADWPLVVAPPTAGGYRLPTEAEWERAAAWDGSKHWIYGFVSDTLTGNDRCNYNYINPLGLATNPTTSPVGWFDGANISPNGNVQTVNSPSPVGAYDMSGNTCQYVHDYYSAYDASPQTNPTGPATGTQRIIRSASWAHPADSSRTASRWQYGPYAAYHTVGFRIARTDTTQYTLTYTAGAGGTITGTSPQAVPLGGSGTQVTAQPNPGYYFAQWSDGVLTASRTDTGVTGNITVTAQFTALPAVIGFAINGGASTTSSTTVILNNTVTDEPTDYMASESPSFAGASWHPYAAAPSFVLSWGVGTRTVYFKVKNAHGESVTASDEIFLLPSMVSVPWCTFTMGRTNAGDDLTYGGSNETPQHQVSLGAYQIGKYIATNKEFCDVLNWAKSQHYLKDGSGAEWIDIASSGDICAGASLQPIFAITDPTCNVQFSGGTFSSKTRTGLPGTTDYSMDRHPLVDMYWFGAVAFCNWLSQWQGLTPCYDMGVADWPLVVAPPTAGGYRLPTEAEWERAAAWDGSKHWIYGFVSDTLTGNDRCNYNYINPLGLATNPTTSPVGWFDGANISPNGNVQTVNSPSPVGAYDMSGNTCQYVHDYYSAYDASPQTNPTGPSTGTQRIIRSASWAHPADSSRTASRWQYGPYAAYHTVGFRIARTDTTQYTLTYTAGANGSVSGTTPQILPSGGSGTAVQAIPNSHYHFVNWSDSSTANPRTDVNVTANKSVTATFAVDTRTLTYTAGANGSISGTTPQTVPYGGNGTAVTAVATTPHYHFVKWSDGSTANPRTDTNVTADISVSASFAIDTCTVTYTVGSGGYLDGETEQIVPYGGSTSPVAVRVKALLPPYRPTGSLFYAWSDGKVDNPRTDTNVTGNMTVNAVTAPIPGIDVVYIWETVNPVTFEHWTSFWMGNCLRGDDQTYGNADEHPVHSVSLHAYEMTRHPVTNTQFCFALNYNWLRGDIKDSAGSVYSGSGNVYNSSGYMILAASLARCNITFSSSTIAPFAPKMRQGIAVGGGVETFDVGSHPVTDVTWYGAVWYCRRYSGLTDTPTAYTNDAGTLGVTGWRLPSEAEWERAAAWNSSSSYHYIYASQLDTNNDRRWGNFIWNPGEYMYVNPLGLSSQPYTNPIGWYNGSNVLRVPPQQTVWTIFSNVGCYDMDGNVSQWVHDWYSSTYYTGGVMTDPFGPASGTQRCCRGGSWRDYYYNCRSARRGCVPPDATYDNLGFRLARYLTQVVP